MSPVIQTFANGSIYGYRSFVSAAATSYESIATVTVGSGGASNVEFTSIPATYSHLQLRLTARSTGTGGGSVDMIYRVNGDTTTSNYRTHLLYGDGSNAQSGTIANQAYITDVSTVANTFGVAVVDFLDYANTNKYKTVRSLGGFNSNGSITDYILLISSLWMSTNAITSIKINMITGNLAEYSSFALYGIKSA